MSGRDESPPRFARALLDLLLAADDIGTATGDLDEEYTRFVLPKRGRHAARRWYWGQVLRSAPRILAGRFRSGRPSEFASCFVEDVRYAARILIRRPGFAVAVVATLTLALGVNSTVFSVVDAVLVAPLPYQNADRLVRPIPDELFYVNSRQEALLEQRMTTFETHAAWSRTLFLFTTGADAEEVRGARVDWNHFEVLGADPRIGRSFDRADAVSDDAIVLSHGLWVRRYGADPAVVGTTVEVSGRETTVIGVMGPDHVPMEFDWEAWRPLPVDPARSEGMALAGNALLKPGVTMEQARDELRRVLPEIWAGDGAEVSEEDRASVTLEYLDTWVLGDSRGSLLVLTAAVAFLLLLACVNVAGLLVAQGSSREREFAVRRALGGSAFRVAGQRAVEVGLLFLAGGLGALMASTATLQWFRRMLPAELPRTDHIAVSPRVVGYTLGLALIAAGVTGVMPALRTQRGTATGLGSSRGSSAGRGRVRVLTALVATEMAFAVVLVVGAGLMLRTLATLRSVDPGFDSERVVTVRPSPPSSRYPIGPELDAFYAGLIQGIEAIPEVESVGAIQFLPMTPGGWWDQIVPEDGGATSFAEPSRTAVRVVLGAYFESMGIEPRAGRLLVAADGLDESEPVVVVNELVARQAFPGIDPIGRSVVLSGQSLRVVGVVGDVRQSDLRSEAHPEVYLPFGQVPRRRMHLVARVESDPGDVLAAVAAAVRSVDPKVALVGPRELSGVVSGTLTEARLVTALLTLFGAVGLGLGAVGVYGVTSQSVSERRREIGVRLALGAPPDRVLASTIGRGLLPVAVGGAAGMLVAVSGTHLLEGLLYGVEPLDPGTFLIAPATLVLVAVTALSIPALRASRVDPVGTLREE